jgi:hypothetical protein
MEKDITALGLGAGDGPSSELTVVLSSASGGAGGLLLMIVELELVGSGARASA